MHPWPEWNDISAYIATAPGSRRPSTWCGCISAQITLRHGPKHILSNFLFGSDEHPTLSCDSVHRAQTGPLPPDLSTAGQLERCVSGGGLLPDLLSLLLAELETVLIYPSV